MRIHNFSQYFRALLHVWLQQYTRNTKFLFIICQQILPPPGSSLAKGDCVATILSPTKAKVSARITHEAANGALRIEFIPTEVGTHIIEVSISGTKLVGGPLIAKVYDTGLIQVTEVNGGVVGQPCQFRGIPRT